MKNIKVISGIIMLSLLTASCGNTAEPTAETTILTPAETAATEEEEMPSETTVTFVELTADNYFDIEPEETEWGSREDAADIISLVDMDYISSSFEDIFYIDSPEDLASLTYFVNTYPISRTDMDNKMFLKVDLMSDIDLEGYNWAPLGIYTGSDHAHAFEGMFIGNGHTISNLTISNGEDDNGFFGDLFGSAVCGLYLEDAEISGGSSKIMAGHIEDVRFIDCSCTGTLTDCTDEETLELFPTVTDPGNNRFVDCSISVTNADGITVEEDFTINPFEEGSGNIMIDTFDPDGDEEYEYTVDFFEEN